MDSTLYQVNAQSAPGDPRMAPLYALAVSAGAPADLTRKIRAGLLLVATAQHDTATSVTPTPSIGYQVSSDNGSTWGSVVIIASGKYLAAAADTNSGVASGARIIDMTGMNAIRLSGTGTLSGSLIWVEGA